MSARPVTRLYWIRHAEVEARYQQVFGGRLDVDLSPRGEQQARALADWLRATPFDAVYASPMRRVRRTLAPLLDPHGAEPVFLDDLREVDFGAWTGCTWAEVQTRFGRSPFDWLHALEQGEIPDAEPLPAYRRRVAGALDHILARHPAGTVAVFCHGGVIRMALAHLLELPLSKMAHFEVDYASLTVVACPRGRPEVQLLNFTPWQRPA